MLNVIPVPSSVGLVNGQICRRKIFTIANGNPRASELSNKKERLIITKYTQIAESSGEVFAFDTRNKKNIFLLLELEHLKCSKNFRDP